MEDANNLIYQDVIIANPRDLRKKLKLRFLVDTGATGCAIPEKIAKKLKLEQMGGGEIVLADGSTTPTKTAYVYLEIGNERVLTLATYNGCVQPLLGLDVMSVLGLQVNAQNKQVLKPLRLLKLRKLVFKGGWVGGKRYGKLG